MMLFALRNMPSISSTLLDVGANLGIYSLSAASAGFSVFAIEPMPFNAILLDASIAQNNLRGNALPGWPLG